MPHLDIKNLVRTVGAGLERLVPSGISVRSDEGTRIVSTPLGEDYLLLGHNIEMNLAEGASTEDAVRGASLNMMNELQDVVTHVLRRPWPPEAVDKPFEFAAPRAEVRDGILLLWFDATDMHADRPLVEAELNDC